MVVELRTVLHGRVSQRSPLNLLFALCTVIFSCQQTCASWNLGSSLAEPRELRGPPLSSVGFGAGSSKEFVDQSGYVGLRAAPGAVIAFADFNRDRFIDVAMLDTGSLDAVQVALWNHDMFRFEQKKRGIRLSEWKSKCPMKTITAVAPADFNNDGTVDLFVTDGVSGCVFYGDGEGGFYSDAVTVLGDVPKTFLVLDANADLVVDLFVAYKNGTRGFYEFSAKASGSAGLSSNLSLPQVSYHAWYSGVDPVCSIDDGGASLPAFVDIDGDCLADLVVPTACGIEVWSNPAHIPKPFWEMSVSGDASLYQLLGIEYYNPAHGDTAVFFADVNADGTVDIAVPNRNRQDLLIFLNKQRRRERGNLCSRDPRWTLSRRIGLASGLNLRPSYIGPLFHRTSFPTTVHVGDYDLDGLADLLVVDSKISAPVIFKNLGKWSDEDISMTPHFAPIAETSSLRDAIGHKSVVSACFFDTDESGRQDIILVQSRNATSLIWNSLITKSDSLFFKGTGLSGLSFRSMPRPFAPVPGISFKISYMARNSRHRVTRECSQCSQTGAWTLQPCYCMFGLLEISNYIEEMVIGAGYESKTWTNLMPNSMAVVWGDSDRGSSGWWMEYFTQRRGGQMLRVVAVFTLALCALSGAIFYLQQKERKEDRESSFEQRVQLFNFGGGPL